MSEKSNQSPRTLREMALATVPASAREALLALAAEHGIARSDDPFWTIAAATASALAAAAAAGEAAVKTTAEVARISDAIYQGTVRAATDLRGQVETAGQGIAETIATRAREIQQGLRTAVGDAINASAARLETASQTLDQAALQRRDAAIKEWEAAAGKAAAAAVQREIGTRLVRGWAVTAVILLTAAALGAAGALGAARLTNHLTPWDIRLAEMPAGQPDCGQIQNQQDQKIYNVCVTQ